MTQTLDSDLRLLKQRAHAKRYAGLNKSRLKGWFHRLFFKNKFIPRIFGIQVPPIQYQAKGYVLTYGDVTTLLLGRRLKHLAARHSWRRVHEIGVGGYGILGIYLKKRFPELSISGSSIFEDEITSSRKVASMNSAPLELFHSDVLDRVEGRYDAIWWNLPYYDRRIVFLLDKLFGQIVEKSLLRPGGMLTLGFNSIPLDAETVLSSMRRYSYFRLIGFETFWWNPHVVMTIECHPA